MNGSHQLPKLAISDPFFDIQQDFGTAVPGFFTNESSAPTNDQSLVICRSPKAGSNSQISNLASSEQNQHTP